MKIIIKRFILIIILFVLSACQLQIHIKGKGVIETDVAHIECFSDKASLCYNYPLKQTVKLTPKALRGYEFTGWKGDCSGLGYCTLNMNEDYYVEAEFLPIASLTITNESKNLNDILEDGQLHGSCDRYYDDIEHASEYLKLMCGKWMYFYDGFDLGGIPAPMIDLLLRYTPESMGESFKEFGLIPDPYAPKGLPLGLVKGQQLNGVDSVAFGCASCHFAQVSDGRYSVGAANHNYDYGKQILSLIFTPMQAVMPGFVSPLLIDSMVSNYLKPQVDELLDNTSLLNIGVTMMPIMSLFFGETAVEFPMPSLENQRQYMSWKPGVQDFVINPSGLDDKAHTISKIQTLWNMYTPEDMVAHGGDGRTFYGFTGSTPDLYRFLLGFVALSWGSERYDHKRLKPLREYILTLKAPKTIEKLDEVGVERGKVIFDTRGCLDCHNGPSYSGTRLYTFEEIGTDEAIKHWGDYNLDGISETPQLFQNGVELTHKIKVTKLAGLWAQELFLHNGSVESLEDLLCIGITRPTIHSFAFSDKGHVYGCDFTPKDKEDLIVFLKSL
jgi:hypothetical protein